MRKILSALAAALLLVSVAGSGYVKAEQPNQLTVSPALINVELSDANPQQKTQIAITNTYVSNIDLTAQLRGIDEISGKLLPTGAIDPIFAQSIKLSKTSFVATAKSTTILEVLVTNSASLSPGGHYATLVLQQKPKADQASGYNSEISISIFVIKRGGERQDVTAEVIGLQQSLISLPQKLQLRFTNTGNTHVTPRASAIVSTSKGDVVSRGVANTGSQPLLPTKSLDSKIDLKQTSLRWKPQKLLLTVNYRVDGSETVKQYQKTFWYVPPIFIFFVLVLLALLAFGMRRLIKWRHKKKAKSEPKPVKTIVLGLLPKQLNRVNPAEAVKIEVVEAVEPQKTTKASKKSPAKAAKKPTKSKKTTTKKKPTVTKQKTTKPKQK